MSSPNPDSVTLNDKKRRVSMPSTPALLIGITVFVAILTYILPTGAFERMEDPNTGRTIVVPGTYAPVEGNPTSDIHFNPNNSYNAVEGILSPDGRILGKMGHSERSGENLYANIPDLSTQEYIFRGAVDYFR